MRKNGKLNFKNDFIKNEGLVYTKNGKSIISQMAASSPKKGQVNPVSLSSAIIEEYLNPLRGVPSTKPLNNQDKTLTIADFQPCLDTFCYKNINERYLPSIKRGQFRLGTILSYRKTEGKLWQDPSEGRTMLYINGKQKDFFTIVLGGLNHFLFCASLTENKDENLSKSFGNIRLKIHLHQFADAVAKSINARDYFIQKIQYTDSKTLKIDLPDLIVPDNLDGLDEVAFEYIVKHSSFPSLFIKPSYFSNENEVRIVFEMNRNVKTPITITDNAFLKSIQII